MQNEEKRTGNGDRVMTLTEGRMPEDGRDDEEQRMNDVEGGDRGEELGHRLGIVACYWASPTRLRLSGYLFSPDDPNALCQTPRLRTSLYSPATTSTTSKSAHTMAAASLTVRPSTSITQRDRARFSCVREVRQSIRYLSLL